MVSKKSETVEFNQKESLSPNQPGAYITLYNMNVFTYSISLENIKIYADEYGYFFFIFLGMLSSALSRPGVSGSFKMEGYFISKRSLRDLMEK